MLLKLILRLSALSLGLSYVTCTTPQQAKEQLATLHERVNQMISSLYSSPLLSKVAATPSFEEHPLSTEEATYPAAPLPEVVYMSPPPTYLEAGAQPNDYGYPTMTNPVPRAALPSYLYEFSSYQPFAPPAPYLKSPYPDYARSTYPQPTLQPPVSPALPFPASFSYSQPPLPSQFPSPLAYPSFCPPQIQYPSLMPNPVCPSGFSVPPPLPPAPYPPQCSVPSLPLAYPQIPYPQSSFSSGYPPSPYPPPIPAPFSCLPPQQVPSLPAPNSSPRQQQYAPSLPLQYPPMPYPPSSIQYSPYPQPAYPPPSAFPKPSDILPQPQYEYSS